MARSPLFRRFIRILQTACYQNQAEGKSLSVARKPQLTRRRFLKLTTLAGGAAIATTALPGLQTAWSRSTPTIAIIGGGIAGLNAAYQLKKLGLIATVYEAKPHVGGRIQSLTGAVSKGLVNDLGGCFINTDHEDILTLVREFGLELFDRTVDAENASLPATAYYFNGRRVSEAELAQQLRPLAQQITADAALLDEDFDRYAPRLDRMSVTDYLNHHADKIPVPFVRTLVENSIRTEYGVEPEQSSALQLLSNLPTVDGSDVEVLSSSDEVFMVKGGSGKIIDSLAAALSGQIQTNRRLTKIQSQGSGFRLSFDKHSVVSADYVIIAIPFPVLRHIDIQAELPGTLRRFINEVELGLNEKLFAGFRQRVWRQNNGFVGEAWTNLGFSQVWEDTQRQLEQQEGVLTFFLGGNEVRATRAGTAGSHGQRFLNRLETVMPGVKGTATWRFLRTNWAGDPYARGGYTSFKPGQYTEFSEFLYIESDDPEERQDVRVGNLVFAGEHLSDEFLGYMNGAAQTGRLAAEVAASQI